MEYEDMPIVCRDCNKEFVFTANGQKFFAEKGFSKPSRCKSCREIKKANGNSGERR